jgi:hypothetical protein
MEDLFLIVMYKDSSKMRIFLIGRPHILVVLS